MQKLFNTNLLHENKLVHNKANYGMCDLKYEWSHCPHVLRCMWPPIIATPTAQQTVAMSLRHNCGKVRVSPLLLLQWSQWIDHTHAQCVKLFHSSICINHDSTKISTIYCLHRQSARQKLILAQIRKHTHQEKQQLIQPQMIAQLHVQPTNTIRQWTTRLAPHALTEHNMCVLACKSQSSCLSGSQSALLHETITIVIVCNR